MKLKNLLIVLFVPVLFSFSCTTYKNVPYFQDLKRDSVITEKINNFSPLTIQPGDLLGINVNSLNHEADAVFNYNLERPSGVNSITSAITAGSQSENTVFGYLVDNDGNIHLPMVGVVKVAGLNTTDIASLLEIKASDYLTKPVVNVRILNFKISVLGDVKNPGSYNLQNEKITLNEAIALSGDLNTTGLRNNILLIREVDGTRKYITLDLRSKSILSSPYYYLKNNDIIYVQPNRDKVSSTDSAFTKASLILAALSLLAIFLTRK